jgi:hypothetical protein
VRNKDDAGAFINQRRMRRKHSVERRHLRRQALHRPARCQGRYKATANPNLTVIPDE